MHGEKVKTIFSVFSQQVTFQKFINTINYRSHYVSTALTENIIRCGQ